ncbi:pilus assembly protein TadG-related protein [Jiella marina]|uniref:pilus assembly protein TadG-related protein n=1 Tax=Jiella sp. LLJ827 TaxID=2917712 RepID=UPI0021015AF8|nr:pilus assembly protein TadG-related protein [Jiella sp. LLJ827]MCQ0988541.1 pilus assembly protein TadG-related protein [Jiella sp. LLJ827]
MLAKLRSFLACRNGNFALITALVMPVLLLVAGGGVNYSLAFATQTRLQSAADGAALAAARELYLANTKPELLQRTIETMVAVNLNVDPADVTTEVSFGRPQQDTAAKAGVLNEVTVELSMDVDLAFPIMGFDEMFGRTSALATARVSGGGRICMIALAETGNKIVDMSGDAQILADTCAVYSNSVATIGVSVTQLAKLSSELTCSAGGYFGLFTNYEPMPLTDCPAVKDPLVSRVAETPTHCDHEKLTIKDTNKNLYPGIYCGDIKLSGTSDVVLLPGTYTFWNGSLRVEKGATLTGEGVSLVFLGKKAGLQVKNDTEIALSASQTGAMAGILIYADRDTDKDRKFRIESHNARKMVGTIYMPEDTLTIGGDKNGDGVCDPDPVTGVVEGLFGCDSEVGQISEWTAIVAKAVEVTAGVKLVLNTDYEGSTVPVPAGVGPVGRNIALTR